ncbi:MAG TPA: two-component sensor histidine kinase, partial [Alteromonas sp.]|nr:two-component sensor histidine kinase [Alteromonas sp.]
MLISSLILVIFSAAIHGYRAALSMSSRFMDQELTTLLYSVALSNGQQMDGFGSSELVYQIWRDGTLITDSPNQPDEPLTIGADGFSEQNFDGRRWRVYKQTLTDGTTVIVGQPLQSRVGLTDALTVSV